MHNVIQKCKKNEFIIFLNSKSDPICYPPQITNYTAILSLLRLPELEKCNMLSQFLKGDTCLLEIVFFMTFSQNLGWLLG